MSLSISDPGTILLYKGLDGSIVITGSGQDNQVGATTDSLSADGLPEGMEQTNTHSVTDIADAFTVNAATELITFGGTHGLTVGQKIRFFSTGALPSPLAIDTDYFVISSGFTTTACKVSLTSGGSAVDLTDTGTGTHYASRLSGQPDTLILSGTPTESGIFTIGISFVGRVSSVMQSVTSTLLCVVEGDGWLGFYHVDEGATPDEVRNAVDLQYSIRDKSFASATFDVESGLDLSLGETLRLHAIISRNGARTLADGTPSLPSSAPSPLRFIIRPRNRPEAAPIVRFGAPSGTDSLAHGAGATRPVPYFDVAVGGSRLRRLFRQLNRDPRADEASISFPCEGQLAFTLDGRLHVSPRFKVNIIQPLER